jgi:hypothetical protein
MGIPSQTEYEARERREAIAKEWDLQHAPRAERKEAQADYLEAMKEPDLVAERLGWLFDGNYGYGPMMVAREVLANKRMNRVARLGQLIACHEWQCPQPEAMAAWHKLTKAQQDILERAIKIVISEAEKDLARQEG